MTLVVAIGASMAQAAPVVVLVDDPAQVSPRQRRFLERELGEVAFAPLGSLWQRGRASRWMPKASGPCAMEVEAASALGPLLTAEQRPRFLQAWVDVALCAEDLGLTHAPFRWDLPVGAVDPFAMRAAALVAADPALGTALDEPARALLARQDLGLPNLVVMWDPAALPPTVDGLPAVPVDGQFEVAPCGADLTWSYGELPGGTEHVSLERGVRWDPLEVAARQGRELLRQLQEPPLEAVHLEHAAIYEGLVGRFAVADLDGRMRVWRWQDGAFLRIR